MSYGLQFFEQVMQAAGPDQRYPDQFSMLLDHLWKEPPYECLTRTLQEHFAGPQDIRRKGREEQAFVSDDEGPNATWCWSNEDKFQNPYFGKEQEDLRKWAYMMWDKERVDRCGVLDTDIESLRAQRHH